ncbi:hypothetical protein ACFL3E_00730 [Patescibacteria group bacterium]
MPKFEGKFLLRRINERGGIEYNYKIIPVQAFSTDTVLYSDLLNKLKQIEDELSIRYGDTVVTSIVRAAENIRTQRMIIMKGTVVECNYF